MDFRTYRRVRTFIVSLLATALARTVWADPVPPPIEFHVEGGDATTTLTEFSRQAHLQLLFDYNVVKGHATRPLDGTYQPADALKQLLANSDLEFDFVNPHTLAVTQKKVASEEPKVAAAAPRHEPPQRRARSKSPAKITDALGNPLDVIRITGTYVRDEPPVGEEIVRLSREDIEATGAATPADFLRTLPQAFGGGPNQDTHIGNEATTNSGLGVGVNLRGLGARATLVLINGRRVAPSGTEGEFVDIENIPLSAIERVDILPDSASAIYGADAVGGVVNFILRDKLDGGETIARGGSGTRGDLQEYLLAQTLGKTWDGGRALISFEFYDRGALPAADRAYAVSDLRPFGGSDLDSTFSNPGNILDSMTGRLYPIPAGQNGTHLTAAELIPGMPNLQSIYPPPRQIIPSQKRWTLYGSTQQELGDRFTLSGAVLAGHREASQTLSSIETYVKVPSSNPFYVNPSGGSGPVVVAYDFGKDLGLLTGQIGIDTLNATVGLDFDAGASWTVRSYASYVREKQNEVEGNELNSTALDVALADPSPLTAFNAFGDGSNTNPATLQAIRTSDLFWVNSQLETVDITADGPLGELGGVPLKLAVGADWRRELFSWTELMPGTTATSPIIGSSLSRTVVSAFGQLVVPIFSASSALPGLHRLEVSAAGRYENYSGSGGNTAPKYSLVWSPLPSLSLRATWSRSARPPALYDLDTTHNGVTLVPLANPAAPGGTVPSLVLSGGNARVRSERAQSWTTGLDFAPLSAPGLSLGFTYFRTRFIDRIQTTLGSASMLVDPAYAALVTHNPTAAQIDFACNQGAFTHGTVAQCESMPVAAIVDLRTGNVARLLTDGIDFNSNYTRSTGRGDLAFALGGTWLHHFSEAQTPGQPLSSLLDTPNQPINLRLRASAGWQSHGWGAQVAANFTNSYRDTESVPQRRVDSWTTIDVQLGYDFPNTGALQGTRVTLDARNVFNVDPPFLNNQVTLIGYDQENANPYGRQLSLQLRKKW
jgi:iron complex outermembrane recepter protein